MGRRKDEKTKKKRLEQRERAKMVGCSFIKHKVVSKRVFLPFSG